MSPIANRHEPAVGSATGTDYVNTDLRERRRCVLAVEHRNHLRRVEARAVIEAQRHLAPASGPDRDVGL
jgi:hypothetical protein